MNNIFYKFSDSILKKKHKFLLGFTIIESIVAVGIIAFSVTGPLAAAKKGLSATSDSLEYSKAIFLSEEGLEYVRMIIDQNVLNDVDWLNDLDPCIGANNYCGVATMIYWDTFPRWLPGIVDCDFFLDCELRTDSDYPSLYSYKLLFGWDGKSGIKRKINIIETVDNKEALVTVRIEKRRAGYPTRIFSSQAVIFNWKHQPHSI
jgi:hypothetical protein